MAGTATRFSTDYIRAGSVGQLWYNTALPGANARMSLHTDGTPDSTANPNAKHLGMTRAGATIKVVTSITDFFADEFPEPIKSTVDQVDGSIEGELLQVFDIEALKALTAANGTVTVDDDFEEISFGIKPLSYVPVALIFPTEADPSLFAVFHLYKAINTSGLTFGVGRKDMSGAPFMFKGYGIPTRAKADTLGKFWQQKG